MKRIYHFFLTLIFGIISLSAHEVNNYKYLCLDIDENPFGIEKRISNEFKRRGFDIIDNETFLNLNEFQKALTLFADYDYKISTGESSLTLILKNESGDPVWSNSGSGSSNQSATGDMIKCTKLIMRAFDRLKYEFDESLNIDFILEKHPFYTWTEDSVKEYLNHNKASFLEGIYKSYANDGDAQKFGIIKHNDKYFGIILESDNDKWKVGETRFVLSPIERTMYDAELIDRKHKRINAIAELKQNRALEFSTINKRGLSSFTLIKVYPSGSETAADEGALKWNCKTTGSGVLISDNLIITNHHVIDNAGKIEAIINIDGVQEAYEARVLCSDKKNDLAIVCIKDNKFKPLNPAPFGILSNTVDVGTPVFTMGFPLSIVLGDEVKITDGIISSKTGYDGDIVTYQISAPIQPGNSGGPLFDKEGNLVGITNAKIESQYTDNIGYAIKSSYVISLIDSAPINISVPQENTLSTDNLQEIIKELKPYVVYLKVY